MGCVSPEEREIERIGTTFFHSFRAATHELGILSQISIFSNPVGWNLRQRQVGGRGAREDGDGGEYGHLPLDFTYAAVRLIPSARATGAGGLKKQRSLRWLAVASITSLRCDAQVTLTRKHVPCGEQA